MADSSHPGSGNLLPPWRPGESGNPNGSSQRQRARAAAKRISGLAPALRELLNDRPPEVLLAELSDEQRAAMDGSETLARYLAAKLVTSAGAAENLSQLLSALSLIASIDSRNEPEETLATDQAMGMPWQEIYKPMPLFLKTCVLEWLGGHVHGVAPADNWPKTLDAIVGELNPEQLAHLQASVHEALGETVEAEQEDGGETTEERHE